MLLGGGGRCLISCVILHQLTTASVFPSAMDEDDQTSNADGKEDSEKDENNPGSSLDTEGWREGEGFNEGTPARGLYITIGGRGIQQQQTNNALTSACFAELYQQMLVLWSQIFPLGKPM